MIEHLSKYKENFVVKDDKRMHCKKMTLEFLLVFFLILVFKEGTVCRN